MLLLMAKRTKFTPTKIRQWRKHRDLTLEQVADLLDMTPSHLSMLERGERGYTQETLEQLARALKTDVASLLLRDPSDSESIWPVWEQAKNKPGVRQQIVEIAKTLIRTGS